MRPRAAARPMSFGSRVGSLGTPSPGLRPRTADVEPVDADEDIVLDAARLVLVAGGFFSGESESPKLSLSSKSGDAATSMLATIAATVGTTMAVGETALQLPCSFSDIAGCSQRTPGDSD